MRPFFENNSAIVTIAHFDCFVYRLIGIAKTFHLISPNWQVNEDVDSTDDEFDEYITLGKSTQFQTVKWKFPDTEKCPLDGCDISFSNRSFAIIHFRSNHSSTAMLCTICNIPFPSACTSNLEQHYELYHPDASLPTMKTVRKQYYLQQQRNLCNFKFVAFTNHLFKI